MGDTEVGEVVGDTVGDTVVGEAVGDTVGGEVVGGTVVTVGEAVGSAVGPTGSGTDVGAVVGASCFCNNWRPLPGAGSCCSRALAPDAKASTSSRGSARAPMWRGFLISSSARS